MNPSRHSAWAMLAALTAAFALSHAFRTVVTLIAVPLRLELGLGNETIALVGGAFHIAFGTMQLPMGVALDLYGPRRVVAAVFPAAVAGAVFTAFSSDVPSLVVGQLLIGLGCSPVFLATLVMIGRGYPPEQFSRLSGIVLGVGGAGMLITGTPLAWVVATWSWRTAYLILALVSLGAWVLAALLVPRDAQTERRQRSTFGAVLQQTKAILVERQTMGIVALGAVTYASFISLRGLWLVPILTDRHGFMLVQSGHVALAGSIAALLGPPLFGRMDPGGRSRRWLIAACTLAYAGLFALLAMRTSSVADVVLTVTGGALAGYFVLQYADVRSAFAPGMAGRALAVFNTSMFLGVAAMQWASGLAASAAAVHGMSPLDAALWVISVLLLAGGTAFVLLPWPPTIASFSKSERRKPGNMVVSTMEMSMYDHIGIKVKDLKASAAFYAAVLEPLGHVQGYTDKTTAGFGPKDAPALWLYKSDQPAGPGTHVALRASDRAAVDRFYQAALKVGGRDNGAPGPRPDYSPTYYAAFVIDPDGNNVEAVMP